MKRDFLLVMVAENIAAEADGTLRLTDEGFFDYKVSGKKLTLVHGDETREFTKWDKNIGHIEEHPDWKK